jgi:hypothetical protein
LKLFKLIASVAAVGLFTNGGYNMAASSDQILPTGQMQVAQSSQSAPPKERAIALRGALDRVHIERVGELDFKDKYIAMYRLIEEQCIRSKLEVANAQGWTFSPASERSSDSQILDTFSFREREWFSGSKYARIDESSRAAFMVELNPNAPPPYSREGTCKLVPYKSKYFVSMDYKTCVDLTVEYDSTLSVVRRTRTAIPGCQQLLTPAPRPEEGEIVGVGTLQEKCRWIQPLLGALASNTRTGSSTLCVFTPAEYHKGTNKPLVAIIRAPDNLRLQPFLGIEGVPEINSQAVSKSLTAVKFTYSQAFNEDVFDFPAESKTVPLDQ